MIYLFRKKKFEVYFVVLLIFSLFFNQYFGNRGLSPLDSAGLFGGGYRVLNGDFPFKDYWVTTGPFIDYFQGLLFLIFGTSWQVYVFHASLLNGLLTVGTFAFLKNLKLDINYSFFYSFCFSILAYPSSGTPFVDHHSIFLSLLGVYCFVLGLQKQEKIYWISIPFLIGLAFLSKQVPSSYIFLSMLFTLVFYYFIKKKIYWLKYLLLSSAFFVIFFFILLFLGKTKIYDFLNQYIFYSSSFGGNRLYDIDFSFKNLIGDFKFIYLCFLPFLFINLKNLYRRKSYIKEFEFYKFLIITFSVFALIFHQILTKNQMFIFFLVPLAAAMSQVDLRFYDPKKRKLISIFLITICIFATAKYHDRFNTNRKFHDFKNVDFKKSVDPAIISKKLSGLRWITPDFHKNPKKEINMMIDSKNILNADKRKKMIFTNYSILYVVLEDKIYAPGRWYVTDGSTHPIPGNKYYNQYKKFLINLIIENDIEVIFVTAMNNDIVYNYINQECLIEKKLSDFLSSYDIKRNCINFLE